MKFELDTHSKTVKLLEDCTLGEINETLKTLLGNEVSNYRIITHIVNYNPVVIERRTYPWPFYPTVMYGGTTTGINGNFLVEGSGTTNCLTVSELQANN